MYVVCPVKNTRTTIFFCSSVSVRVGKKYKLRRYIYTNTEVSTRTNVLLLKKNIYIYQNFSSIHNNYQRFEEPKWPIHTVELRKRRAGTPKGKLLFWYIFICWLFFPIFCVFCSFWVCFVLFPLFWTLLLFFQLFHTFSLLSKRNYYFITTFSLFFSFFAIFPSFSVNLYNAYLPLCHGDPLRVSLSPSLFTQFFERKNCFALFGWIKKLLLQLVF